MTQQQTLFHVPQVKSQIFSLCMKSQSYWERKCSVLFCSVEGIHEWKIIWYNVDLLPQNMSVLFAPLSEQVVTNTGNSKDQKCCFCCHTCCCTSPVTLDAVVKVRLCHQTPDSRMVCFCQSQTPSSSQSDTQLSKSETAVVKSDSPTMPRVPLPGMQL